MIMAVHLGPRLRICYSASAPSYLNSRHSVYITGCFRASRFPVQRSSKVYHCRLSTKATRPRSVLPAATPRTINGPQPVRAGAYQTVGQSLALRPSPTLLYQSPSYSMFFIGYYLFGGFCLVYAVINFRMHYLNPVPGTPEWVRRHELFGCSIRVYNSKLIGPIFLCRHMSVRGCCWVVFHDPSKEVQSISSNKLADSLRKPYGIILKILALPSSPCLTEPPLYLQLLSTPLVPCMKPSSIIVAAKDVTFSGQLQIQSNEFRAQDTLNSQRSGSSPDTKGRDHLMRNPVRRLNQQCWRAFESLRAWFSMERFIGVGVKDRIWPLKIRVDAVWANKDGRTLDQIVNHKR